MHMKAIAYPGWCHSRLTNFECFVWMNWENIFSEIDLDNYDYGFGSDYNMTDLLSSYGATYYDTVDTDMTMSEDMGSSEDYEERIINAAKTMTRFIYPFCIIFASVANVLSMVIFEKLSRDVTSTSAYIAVLSILELLLLFTRCSTDWIINVMDRNVWVELMVSSQSACKVFPFIFNFVFHLWRWLIVAMAIEGFIATAYPHRATHWCTLQRAKAVMLLLTVLLVCVSVHFFWSFEVEEQHDAELKCSFPEYNIQQRSEVFEKVVWPLADLLIADVIPAVVISVCAVGMAVLTFKGLHRGSDSHQEWRRRYTMDPGAQDQLKQVFMCVSFLYLLCNLPGFAVIVTRFVNETKDSVNLNQSIVQVTDTLCLLLQYIFMSAKFWLFIAICPRFRSELCHIFKCCYGRDDRHQQATLHRPLIKQSPSHSQPWRQLEPDDSQQSMACALNHA